MWESEEKWIFTWPAAFELLFKLMDELRSYKIFLKKKTTTTTTTKKVGRHASLPPKHNAKNNVERTIELNKKRIVFECLLFTGWKFHSQTEPVFAVLGL